MRANPGAPRWFIDDRSDYTARLPEIAIPTLLIWGDADPISPLAVGERLRRLLPRATLAVVPGGAHDVAATHAVEVARLVEEHLTGA